MTIKKPNLFIPKHYVVELLQILGGVLRLRAVPFPLFRRLNLVFPAGISNQPVDGGGRGLSYDFKAGGKNFTLPPDLLSNKQHVSGHPSVQITPCQRPALGLCDGQQTGGREEPSPVFSERARHRDGRPLGAACAPGSTRCPATFFLFAGNLVTAWPQTSRTPSIGGLLWKPPVVTAQLPFFSAWFKKKKERKKPQPLTDLDAATSVEMK